ncbi:MAG: carbohydrate ABC transporter substrate-binding protein [Nocardioidaceae bacterium]|nr:carbohydrate ABC transporter substrate-binding protein [Nocardioidaceae bacterium]
MKLITYRAAATRPLALLTAMTVATAVLAGCSGGFGESGDTSSDGKTTISLSMQNENVELSDPATWNLIQAFETANPDIKIDVSGEPQAQHLQKLTVAAQSGTLPDVFWVYNSTAKQMNQDGHLLDLAPIMDELDMTDRFSETSLSNFQEGDVQYGLPYQALITGYFYNKAILDENGIAVPKTFDDLLAASQKLSQNGVTAISQGASQSSFSVWAFLTDLVRFGWQDKYEAILSGDEKYSNPDFLRLYEHIEQLADAGAFPSNTATQTFQQAVDAFANGEAAFLDGGVWLSSYLQDFPIAKDVGFWEGPTYSDGVGEQEIVMNVPSAPFAVSSKVGEDDAKLEAVKKFLDFYYSDEGQQILVDNGQPPVTTYDPDIPAESTVFQSVIDVAQKLPSPPAQPDLQVEEPVANAMYDSIYGVIQKQLPPEKALDLVQQALENN